jgi:hypothetical protein
MNATENKATSNGTTQNENTQTPLKRLQLLTERLIVEYNGIIEEMRPGEMDLTELGQATDAMMNLANAASSSVGKLLVEEVRNLMTPRNVEPDLVFTYRCRGDNETHCIFDYTDEKMWNGFYERHARDISNVDRNPFDSTQRFRFTYKMRGSRLPITQQFEGTFAQYQEKTKGKTIITDAILI